MIVYITGPMFSSKSARLIEYYKSATYSNTRCALAFKPITDVRDDGIIKSRNGDKINAIKIDNLLEIPDYITKYTTDIFIDEINFFENIPDEASLEYLLKREERIKKIILMFEYLNYEKGVNIYMAGLNFDSERAPFGIAPYLMNIATSIDTLTAKCSVCNLPATHSNYKGYKVHEIEIGSDEYEALCPTCWINDNKQNNEFYKTLMRE